MRNLDFNNDNKKQIEEVNELDNIDAKLLWNKIDKNKILNIKLTGLSPSIIDQQDFNLAYFIMTNKDCSPKYWLCVGINELKCIINGHGDAFYHNIIYQNNNKILRYRDMPLYFLEAEDKQRGLYLLSDVNKEQVKICFFNICGAPLVNSDANISDYVNGDSRTREAIERQIADGFVSRSSIPSLMGYSPPVPPAEQMGYSPPVSPSYAEALALERNIRMDVAHNNTFSHYTSDNNDDNYPDFPF